MSLQHQRRDAVPRFAPPAPATPKAPEAPKAPKTPATPPADDYVPFCEQVRRLCGVDLLQYKRAQMERRIRSWTERRGTPVLADSARRLQADREELDAFLDRVTINVSHLWRHEEQWDALHREILPEIAAKTGRVRAWSAGSSYGAEAFTLAAVCKEAVPRAAISIVGTDLDRRMVARARTGEFSAEDVRTAPAALLHRRLVEALAPGGFLVVGTSERVADARGLGLTSPHHFIYRKS